MFDLYVLQHDFGNLIVKYKDALTPPDKRIGINCDEINCYSNVDFSSRKVNENFKTRN